MPRQKKQHLKRRPDGRYACRYQNQWFYGDTEDEALSAREYYKQQQKAGASAPASLTVAEYALAWLPRAKVNVSRQTYTESAILLEKLLASIGTMPLCDVKPSDIKSVYSTVFADKSESYIRSAAQLYRALFDAAVEDGHCSSNPARQKSARPHKGTTGGHRSITPEERQWILTFCTSHRAHAAVMAMLYAGLRPQEAKSFNISRSVDFDTRWITLTDFAHLSDTNSNQYVITSKGKTDRAARRIPLFTPLRLALEGKSGMLVTSADGNPVTITAWKNVWSSYVFNLETAINGCEERWYGRTKEHKAILAAGGTLPPFRHVTFTPYDLRHSFCTMCRDNGVEINTCIQWMGHSDAKMILKIYDEVSAYRSQFEADRLEKTLFGSQNGSQISEEPQNMLYINASSPAPFRLLTEGL